MRQKTISLWVIFVTSAFSYIASATLSPQTSSFSRKQESTLYRRQNSNKQTRSQNALSPSHCSYTSTYPSLTIIDRLPSNVNLTKSYKQAVRYFQKRFTPKHHFIDIGVASMLFNSLYPLERQDPFLDSLSTYLNYRTAKRSLKPFALIVGLQYAPHISSKKQTRFAVLAGLRYPRSSDLHRVYGDILIGTSFTRGGNYGVSNIQTELRFLATHIIGPKNTSVRAYLQWGFPIQLQNLFSQKNFSYQLAFSIRFGLDFHL